jgi:hypothetical protein
VAGGIEDDTVERGGVPAERRERLPWPSGPIAVLAAALALFAAPAGLEGPVLVPIAPGHAISVVDAVALAPLLCAVAWLVAGMWRRRDRLRRRIISAPGLVTGAAFIGGFGLGLLIASAFSAFFWWWAIGAAVFATFLLSVAVLAGHGSAR